jgi:hypothetical protein
MPGAQASCLHERRKARTSTLHFFYAIDNQIASSRFSNAHAGRMPALPAESLHFNSNL